MSVFTGACNRTLPSCRRPRAAWFLREPMHWQRWLATGIGFGGVLIGRRADLRGNAVGCTTRTEATTEHTAT